MGSCDELQNAWNVVSEKRIRAAQAEGKFADLIGFGRPLEEIMDIEDPYGWIRRATRDIRPCQGIDADQHDRKMN